MRPERRWWRCPEEPSGGCRPKIIDGAAGVSYVIQAADLGATVYTAERAHDRLAQSLSAQATRSRLLREFPDSPWAKRLREEFPIP